jgi:thiol:disulfide interchange protein DsbD
MLNCYILKIKRFTTFIFFYLIVFGSWAYAGKNPQVKVDFIVSHEQVSPGTILELGLYFTLAPHYHIYWENPGASGESPQISLLSDLNAKLEKWLYPIPEKIRVGPFVNYGYKNQAMLLNRLHIPNDYSAKFVKNGFFELSVSVSWLVCSDVCVPQKTTLKKIIHTGEYSKEAEGLNKIVLGKKSLPQALPEPLKVDAIANSERILLSWDENHKAVQGYQHAYFFAKETGFIQYNLEQKEHRAHQNWELVLMRDLNYKRDVVRIDGILVLSNNHERIGYNIAVPVHDMPTIKTERDDYEQSKMQVQFVVLIAFLGGILLNFMPCVFPVISLKLLSGLNISMEKKSVRKWNALAYTLGILISCWSLVGILLFLRHRGHILGWGFQLQSPWVVSLLAIFFTVMALNLLDVFTIGQNMVQVAGWIPHNKYSIGTEFLSGMLSTLIATPCSAPFVGTAIAFALQQPALICFLVFTGLGAGLAFPVLLYSFIDIPVNWLPRPGRWMVLLKKILSFPLWITVVWLVYIFGSQTSLYQSTLLSMSIVVFSLSLFFWGQFKKRIKLFFVFSCLSVALYLWASANTGMVHQERQYVHALDSDVFSFEKVEALRKEGYHVLVDFTALWCVTCQVNERLVLQDPTVIDFLERNRVKVLKGDWTNRDEKITMALQQFHRNSVPLVVFYPQNTDKKPTIFPEILTREQVIDDITKNKE